MLNELSLRATEQATWAARFRRPLHGSYCFAGLPKAISWLLTGEGEPGLPADVFGSLRPPYDTVAFFLFDAFGWSFIDHLQAMSPSFRRISGQGTLSRLTSQFPSTTAAHVTTIHAGLPVGQSGVYAWQYYEPAVGAIIEPLPFAYYGQARNSLRLSGVDVKELVPARSFYQALADKGVHSTVLHPAEIISSPCNKTFSQGADVVGHRCLSDALVSFRHCLQAATEKTYLHLYYDKLDGVSHVYGPGSVHALAEAETVWLLFEKLVHEHLGRQKRTALLISADHGQVEVEPSRVVHVNILAPDVVSALETDRIGRPLARSGSKRDLFLHVKPAFLEGVRDRLREVLRGRAEVVLTSELIEQGFFGPVAEVFLRKVGNLVVLPDANEGVWWYDSEEVSSGKVGHHGGLTPQEMDVPLLVLTYD